MLCQVRRRRSMCRETFSASRCLFISFRRRVPRPLAIIACGSVMPHGPWSVCCSCWLRRESCERPHSLACNAPLVRARHAIVVCSILAFAFRRSSALGWFSFPAAFTFPTKAILTFHSFPMALGNSSLLQAVEFVETSFPSYTARTRTIFQGTACTSHHSRRKLEHDAGTRCRLFSEASRCRNVCSASPLCTLRRGGAGSSQQGRLPPMYHHEGTGCSNAMHLV